MEFIIGVNKQYGEVKSIMRWRIVISDAHYTNMHEQHGYVITSIMKSGIM